MAEAERELRALQRELLLTRAAAERAELADRLAQFSDRTRTARRLAGSVIGIAAPSATPLGMAAAAVGFARRQPWIVPTAAKLLAAVARSRSGRLALVTGLVAAGAWWLMRRQPAPPDAAVPTSTPEPDGDGPEPDG
jgi:hypothetical protein